MLLFITEIEWHVTVYYRYRVTGYCLLRPFHSVTNQNQIRNRIGNQTYIIRKTGQCYHIMMFLYNKFIGWYFIIKQCIFKMLYRLYSSFVECPLRLQEILGLILHRATSYQRRNKNGISFLTRLALIIISVRLASVFLLKKWKKMEVVLR